MDVFKEGITTRVTLRASICSAVVVPLLLKSSRMAEERSITVGWWFVMSETQRLDHFRQSKPHT